MMSRSVLGAELLKSFAATGAGSAPVKPYPSSALSPARGICRNFAEIAWRIRACPFEPTCFRVSALPFECTDTGREGICIGVQVASYGGERCPAPEAHDQVQGDA